MLHPIFLDFSEYGLLDDSNQQRVVDGLVWLRAMRSSGGDSASGNGISGNANSGNFPIPTLL